MNTQPEQPESLGHNETQGSAGAPKADAPDSLEFVPTQGDFSDGSGSEDFGGPESDEYWEEADEVIQIESRYEIQQRLGRGGMGDVHCAIDRRLKRQVAIKRLRDDLEHSRKAGQRFLIEARAIAQLNHYNIVQVYDFGRSTDGFFLVMELVDGDSLAGLLQKNGPMGVVEAVDVIVQICDALTMAHEHGMVHRDIKPGNILVTLDKVAKLSDFGLARLDLATGGQTQAGTTLGTIDFMAPEQHLDAHSVDARSDIWSLGATLYQMVTGSSPRIIRTNRIPEELQPVILQALEDDPADRFQTAEEFRIALESAVGRQRIGSGDGQSSTQQGECGNCHRVNGADKKFCEGCGTSLVVPCLKCGASLSAWTQFCGECGGNVNELVEVKAEELENERRQLGKLLGNYQFDEATARLNAVRALTHPRLVEYAKWAEGQLPDVERRRNEQLQWANEQYQSARAVIEDDAAYSRAIQLLEQIPETILTEEMADLLETSRDRHRELQQLAETIRTATSQRRYDGLLATVERFIELKPNHKKSQILAENLRRRERSRGGRSRSRPAARHSQRPPRTPPRNRYQPPALRGANRLVEEVRRYCSRHSQNGYYVGNQITSKKLNNAIMSYGIPHEVEVIALIDCTVFGSAKDGLAICSDGLYWHNQFETPSRLDWDDFSDAPLQTQGVFQIQFGHHGSFNTAGGSAGRGWILSLLQRLQSVVQQAGRSAPVAPPARHRNNAPADDSSVVLTVVDEGPGYDELETFCGRYKSNGFMVGSAIPTDKLNNARDSYGIPPEDFVVALLDCTVFGGARDGLAVCESGLYWHNQFETACSASWDDFKSATIEKKGIFVIQIGHNGNLSTAGSDAGRKWTYEFLRQLQTFVRNR